MIKDIVCFSHLRWNFVYQRPQHLLTRFSQNASVYFIEEAFYDSQTDFYEIIKDENCDVTVIVPHLTPHSSHEENVQKMEVLINNFLQSLGINNFMLWYYSPMALEYTRNLNAAIIVYDCMDELSAFKFAPPSIKLLELELMEKADVVFTGGHSLFKAKQCNHTNIFSFPSSIDKTHFLTARNIINEPADQESIEHPRLGYYGVIDERININLIEEIASKRPDWQIILIGPVVKIDPASLPRRNNIHYLGSKDYKQLPDYLAGWDIAIMPFALNKSTEYISPTKTPEYLCGGKPVISTSVRDVVLQYGVKELVHIADTANEFIKAAESILRSENYHQWLASVDEFLADMSWDNTYESMKALIEKTLEKRNVQQQI
jgi:hypothetical protein